MSRHTKKLIFVLFSILTINLLLNALFMTPNIALIILTGSVYTIAYHIAIYRDLKWKKLH